ncbi:efflux RND transporter permease subunit [Brevibacterium sp. HMSC063G07]|uniref:efflux RND transporter permease subunit n=1 Tax=Brevibacterium sp. HMSC063G07 TaxID=1739261 RepID=UPI0008D3B079|nr:efflux RND transporter permease subunit [Brevibacterium sp. HMSC063G07]OFL66347.1 acriflavin resistance protein [Brevibacterium sp. HMSC063G07]
MKTLTRLSLKHRALIGLITAVAVMFGFIATAQLKRELFPSFELPQAVISAQYPGASPEAVESEVTEVIEEAVSASESVESVSSTSASGKSDVTAEVSYGTSSDDIVRELEGAIAKVKDQLPDRVDPVVFSGSVDEFPVVVISASSDGSKEKLADDLNSVVVPELKKLPGVRAAAVSGADVKQVNITVDKKKVEDKGVTVDEIVGVLQSNGVAASAGEIEGDNGEAPVEVGVRITKLDQIRDLRVTGKDSPVKLSEVAEIEQVPAPVESISRTNGKESLTLAVTKTPDANTVDVANAVHDALPKTQEKLRGNPEFTTVFDQAPFIQQSIDDLVHEGVLGLVFAVLVILVFLLSVRATIITAISIPLSLLITMLGLWLTGYSLNMLTLSALTISIGRVVDDSIVVIEAIRRRHSMGGTKFSNILAAVSEVASAITASTLTTVAVFLPLVFVTGQTGELFRPFALTTSIALLASLLVALTIVPVLAFWFLRSRESKVRLSREQKKEIAARRKAGLRGLRARRKKRREEAKENPAAVPDADESGTADAQPAAEEDSAGEVEPASAESSPAGAEKGAAVSSAVDEGQASEVGPASEAGHSGTDQEIDELESLRSPVTRLQKTYTPVIGWTVRHPVITLVASVLVLVLTLGMVPMLKTDFLGDMGADTLEARQQFPAGVGLEEAGEIAEPVEKDILATEGVDDLSFSVGSSEFDFGEVSGSGQLSGMYFINLSEGASADEVSERLTEKFKDMDPDESGNFEVVDSAAPGGSTIDIKLTSNDTAALKKSAEKLTKQLEKTDGVKKVDNSLRDVGNVIHIDVKRKKAAEYGLSEVQLGQIVTRAINGQMIGQVVLDDVTNSVYVFDGDAESISDLEDMELTVMVMPDGSPVTGGAGGAGGAGGTGGPGGAGAPGGAEGPKGGGNVALPTPGLESNPTPTDTPKPTNEPGPSDRGGKDEKPHAPRGPGQEGGQKPKAPGDGGQQPQAPRGQQPQAPGGPGQGGNQQPQGPGDGGQQQAPGGGQQPQGPGDGGQMPGGPGQMPGGPGQMPDGQIPGGPGQIPGGPGQMPDGQMPDGQMPGMPQMPDGQMPESQQPKEKKIKLSEVANITQVKTAPVISHSDGLRSVTVSATPDGDDLGAIAAAVQKTVDSTQLEPGVAQDTGGVSAEQADAFKQLGLAMLAAILIVFIILVATFRSLLQPFILLVSIPFAATGSILALLITDTPMGLTAMIGMLMLIGIVVTNAIVLIDLINRFREHGADLKTAVFHGARLRYRPIIMTALATIFALVPMAMGLTGGGVFVSQPLALAVIGGLVSSTLLTLILVPVLYELLEGHKERRAEKRAVKEDARGAVIDKAEKEAEARDGADAEDQPEGDAEADAGAGGQTEDEADSQAEDEADASDEDPSAAAGESSGGKLSTEPMPPVKPERGGDDQQ